jgi:hypothetical protein
MAVAGLPPSPELALVPQIHTPHPPHTQTQRKTNQGPLLKWGSYSWSSYRVRIPCSACQIGRLCPAGFSTGPRNEGSSQGRRAFFLGSFFSGAFLALGASAARAPPRPPTVPRLPSFLAISDTSKALSAPSVAGAAVSPAPPAEGDAAACVAPGCGPHRAPSPSPSASSSSADGCSIRVLVAALACWWVPCGIRGGS